MALERTPRECLMCLSSIETSFVPTEQSQKIFSVCCSYVKDAINIEFLIDNFIGNNSGFSFCKNCLHSSLNLSRLVEQLSNLKKEIHNLSANFSETISKQRIQATTATTSKKNLHRGNSKFNATNNHSEKLLLNESSTDCNSRSSFRHLESSKETIVEQIDIDDLGSEIIKTENDDIFVDDEDKSYIQCSLDDNEEKEMNYLATEDENEVDPFGEFDLKPNYENVNNNCTNIDESQPHLVTSNFLAESVSSSGTKLNLVIKRNRNHAATNRFDDTSNSNVTSYEEKSDVNFHTNHPNRNSKIKTTGVKLQTHKSKKRLYQCSTCQKCFYTLSALKKHLVVHTGERPYKCSVCNRAYSRINSLRIHEKAHIGEKRYKCAECDSSFDGWIKMKEHETTHSQDRPYKCSQCIMAFKLHSTLKDHERTHTGERPYQCHYCEQLFKNRQTRMMHQRRVHPHEQKS